MRMTGWNFENQSELTRLITNSQMGFEMNENEKNRMHQLALEESRFQNTLKSNEQQNTFTKENYQLQNPDPLGLGF
jgi:hypothetical protein